MANTNLIPIGITATTTFATVSSLLNAAGLTQILDAPVMSSAGYLLNRSSSVNLYVGYGPTEAPTAYATLTPLTALRFGAGMNTTLLWIASASSTVACDFVEGGDYQAVTISGVIGTITLDANVIAKGDGSGNLVATDVSADTGKIYPTSDNGAALGDTTHNFSDLFLATGAVLNYANGNVAITHSSGILTMGTGEFRITTVGTNAASVPTLGSTSTLTNKTLTAPVLNAGTVGTSLVPTTDDGAPLGDTTHNFSDLFLATGAVINYANGNVAITHTSGILTMGTGEMRITTPGTNAASVVTVGGTQTLAAKTLTTPVIGVATGTSLAVTGLLTTSSPTAAFGYVTGAGGAQTQATDKSTTVVSNTNTTAITMNGAELAAGAVVSFTFTNSAIAATDTVIVTHQSAGTNGAYHCNAFPGAGSASIAVRNLTAGALSEAIVLRVTIIKSVSA